MNEILSYSSKKLIAVYNKIIKTFLKPKKIQNPLTSNNVVCLSSEETKTKVQNRNLKWVFSFHFCPVCLLRKKVENQLKVETHRSTNNNQKNPKSSFNSSATKQSDKPSKLTKQIVMITYRDCMMFWPLQ